jgi:hypothetical protein
MKVVRFVRVEIDLAEVAQDELQSEEADLVVSVLPVSKMSYLFRNRATVIAGSHLTSLKFAVADGTEGLFQCMPPVSLALHRVTLPQS